LIRIVNPRERPTESAADVEHRLATLNGGEVNHHLIETRLRSRKVAIIAVAPVSEVNGSLRETAAIGVDQAVKVRW